MMSSPDESLPTRSRDHSILQEEKNIPPLAITSGDEEEYQFMSGARLYFVVLGLCLTVLLMGLDNAILATAIPTITTKFNSLDDVGWYGSAYLICTCALQPISGKIYRYFNLKYTYLVYLCIFEFGSLICAISVSSTMLIIGRAIAGCGAAGLFSGAIVIVANSIPLRQRPIYTGAIASMFSVSNIVGPILGGAFTQHVSWRWCFYINLPLGAISIVILVFFFHPHSLPDSNHPITEKMKHLDLPGLILFIPAVVMLLLAVQWGGNTYPWKSAMVIGLIVGAGAVLILFALWQWHQQDEGSIPPRILGHRTVWTAVGVCAFGMGSAQLVAYYLPMWFQVIKGASPLGSGIRFIPTVLGSVVTSIVAGGLVTKFGLYNPWLIAGGITTAISAGIFSTFKTNESSSMINGIQVLGGFASSLAIQMPVIAIMSILPQSDISVGTSMSTFSAFFGGAIFLAIAENIFVSRLVSEIVSKAPSVNAQAVVLAGAQGMRKVVGEADLPAVIQAYNSAITATFYVGTAGGILAFLFSLGVEWKSVKGKQIM